MSQNDNNKSASDEEATGAYDVLRDSTTTIQPAIVNEESSSNIHADEGSGVSASSHPDQPATAQAYSDLDHDSRGGDAGIAIPDITNVQQLGMINHYLRWGFILGALAIGVVSALVTILLLFVLSRAGSTIVQMPGTEKTVTRTVTETPPEPTYIVPQTVPETTNYVPTTTLAPSTSTSVPTTSDTSETSTEQGTSETEDDAESPTTSSRSESGDTGATVPNAPAPPIGGDSQPREN